MSKRPIQVYLSKEHIEKLEKIKKAIGVDSDSEALRAALKLAYDHLKEKGLIQ